MITIARPDCAVWWTLLSGSLALLVGCTTIKDHLAAGRYYEACEAGSVLRKPEVAKAVRAMLRPRVRVRFLQRDEMRRLFGPAGARLYDKAMLVRAEVHLENARRGNRPSLDVGVKFAVELHQGKKILVALKPELRELALMTGELDSAFEVHSKKWNDYGALLRNLLSLPFQLMMLPVSAATGRVDSAIKLEKVRHHESTIKDKALGKTPLASAIYKTLETSCAWELPSPRSTKSSGAPKSLLCLIGSRVDPSKPVELAFRLHYDVKEGSRSCTVWDDLVRIPVPNEPRGERLVRRINRLFKDGSRVLE